MISGLVAPLAIAGGLSLLARVMAAPPCPSHSFQFQCTASFDGSLCFTTPAQASSCSGPAGAWCAIQERSPAYVRTWVDERGYGGYCHFLALDQPAAACPPTFPYLYEGSYGASLCYATAQGLQALTGPWCARSAVSDLVTQYVAYRWGGVCPPPPEFTITFFLNSANMGPVCPPQPFQITSVAETHPQFQCTRASQSFAMPFYYIIGCDSAATVHMHAFSDPGCQNAMFSPFDVAAAAGTCFVSAPLFAGSITCSGFAGCRPGYYTYGVGAITCTACPFAMYCAGGLAAPAVCPAHSFAPAGSWNAAQCVASSAPPVAHVVTLVPDSENAAFAGSGPGAILGMYGGNNILFGPRTDGVLWYEYTWALALNELTGSLNVVAALEAQAGGPDVVLAVLSTSALLPQSPYTAFTSRSNPLLLYEILPDVGDDGRRITLVANRSANFAIASATSDRRFMRVGPDGKLVVGAEGGLAGAASEFLLSHCAPGWIAGTPPGGGEVQCSCPDGYVHRPLAGKSSCVFSVFVSGGQIAGPQRISVPIEHGLRLYDNLVRAAQVYHTVPIVSEIAVYAGLAGTTTVVGEPVGFPRRGQYCVFLGDYSACRAPYAMAVDVV